MKKVLLAALLAAPGMALAAGFASGSLFLSKNPATEGDTVLVYAVVANDAQDPFAGALSVREGAAALGSVSVELKAGEARTVSVSWSPKAGIHTLTAELKSTGGTVVASAKETFSVAEKPKPQVEGTSTESMPVESSEEIQKGIAGVSAPAAQAAQPVFSTIDSWRQEGAQFLDNQIAKAKQNLPKGGVLGAETAAEAKNNPVGSVWTVFQVLYFYLLTILRYIIASAVLFYPLLVVIFLWGLWKLYERMSRPRFR